MAKQIPFRQPSLRLASDLEQCEAALSDKTKSLQHNYAAVKKDLGALRREINKHKDCRDPEKLNKLVEKRDLLRLKVEVLEKEGEQFRDQQQKQLNLLERELHEGYERMQGLLAYGVATGGLSADAHLLYNSLGDYLQAKSETDRASAQRAISLIFDHGDLGDRKSAADDVDDRILTQFESITDPEESSAFHRKHQAEIHRAYEARKNNP